MVGRAERRDTGAQPAHRVDNGHAKGVAWTAIVVLVLVAIVLAASL
jgi:hypothetical protein